MQQCNENCSSQRVTACGLYPRPRDMPVLSSDVLERWRHQQDLQIKGIFVPTLSRPLFQNGTRMYREFRLRVETSDNTLDPVSLKLPAVEAERTPYSFVDGRLLFGGEELSLPGTSFVHVPLPPAENEWHLKGYTFPYRGSRDPYYELRINPRITGYCPGRCVFCHRTHSHRIRPDEKHLLDPAEIVMRIGIDEGANVYEKITRVMLIAELYGHEDRLLAPLAATRRALLDSGYPTDRELNCCAQDVRTAAGLRRLHSLVQPSRYSYTLECFVDRIRIMGKYKGLPMHQVYRILQRAREVGFEEIQLNYMAGLDPLDELEHGFRDLRRLNLVDSVGLSTYTVFWTDGWHFRCEEAHRADYYHAAVSILSSLGIKIYHPESYDMPVPYAALMEETLL